ncbi:MAG: acyl carrier protein [Oculatellaceae cyanobacterium Prado106]|jgi:acyl carrier protein|nr:acyl carrier protein [Oculatellaceae cyanobacterium Prado106]
MVSSAVPSKKQNAFSPESIQAWFVAQLAEQLDLDPEDIDPRDTFESYGLSSAQAMLIATRAEKMLGFQISPSLLFRYPTIAGLSGRLAEEVELLEADLLKNLDPDTLAQALANVENLSAAEAQNLLNS